MAQAHYPYLFPTLNPKNAFNDLGSLGPEPGDNAEIVALYNATYTFTEIGEASVHASTPE